MKNSLLNRICIILSVSALNLAVTSAQTTANPTDSTENSKAATDSTAQQHPATSPATPDRTNSKDTTNSLDKNPSTADTGSASKSATKDPTTATTEDRATKSEKSESSPAAFSDSQFIEKAAEGGMTEVELGKLAQEKGSSADVKEFGGKMVTDHSQANAELKTLALQKNITVPASLDARHQGMVDHFKTLSGPAFDKAYVKAMVKDHQKDAKEFQEASTSAKDSDVRAFAAKTLEVVKAHLTHVEALETKVK